MLKRHVFFCALFQFSTIAILASQGNGEPVHVIKFHPDGHKNAHSLSKENCLKIIKGYNAELCILSYSEHSERIELLKNMIYIEARFKVMQKYAELKGLIPSAEASSN